MRVFRQAPPAGKPSLGSTVSSTDLWTLTKFGSVGDLVMLVG